MTVQSGGQRDGEGRGPAGPPMPGPSRWVRSLMGNAVERLRIASAHAPGGLEYSLCRRSGASLVSVELEDVGSIAGGAFDTVVGEMIAGAFGLLGGTAAPHPVRVWNFLPGMYDSMGPEVDRYRAFNIARHRAFCALLGESAVLAGRLPTASCVGHAGRGLAVHVLGAARPGVAIENPRQVPAFAYSPRYGPRPPCFARATLADIAGHPVLLIGGTASVLGEDSVHDGSRAAQLDETITNLGALIDGARREAGSDTRTSLPGILAARVYYKREADRSWFREHLPAELSRGGEVELVRADICRDELLVEIELIVDPRAA